MTIYLEEELKIRKGETYYEIALDDSFTQFVGPDLINELIARGYTLMYKGTKIESYKELYKVIATSNNADYLASKAR